MRSDSLDKNRSQHSTLFLVFEIFAECCDGLMWQRDCLFLHSEGRADEWVAEGLAEPGASCSGVTLQVAFELGRSHATHFRDLLLVDMQLARLNMGKVDLAPFALAATVAVVLAVHHVSEVLELIGLARNAELFVDAARRGGRDVFPGSGWPAQLSASTPPHRRLSGLRRQSSRRASSPRPSTKSVRNA